MRTIYLFLIALFLVQNCFGQQTQVSAIYSKMNEERKGLCLNQLSINSKLESIAQLNANNLCNADTSAFKGYNYFYNSYTTTGIYDFDNLQGRILTSYSSSKSKWICAKDQSTTSSMSDVLFYRYSLVNAQTIGCAFTTQSSCSKTSSGTKYNAYYFVCVYSIYPSTPVIPSSSCTACSGTTTAPPSTTAPPATTKPPASTPSPTTAAPSTTKPPASTPSPSTTAPPATTKPPATITPSPTTTPSTEKDMWLKAHNDARTCVGVPTLAWDDGLASDAKAWANVLAKSCVMTHSSETSVPARVDQGENLWYIMQSSITPSQLISGGVGMWVDERYDWNCQTNTCNAVCAHYTQLIWRNTTKVGCAYSLCNTVANKYQGVCRYSVKGNWGPANPLAPTVDCAYKCSSTAVRSLTSSSASSATTSSSSSSSGKDFFSTDYELVIFVLCAAIVVIVLSVFILLLVSMLKKRQVNEEDYYQALLKK
jgi:pathogenesis-related protein 1